MKIFVFAEHYLPRIAGSATHVEYLSIALAERGDDVILVVPNEQESTEVHATKDRYGRTLIQVPVAGGNERTNDTAFRERYIHFCSKQMSKWVAIYQPDVIHVMYGHYIYSALSNISNIPMFWTCHNVPPQEYKMPYNEYSKTGQILNRLYRTVVQIKHKNLIRSYPYHKIIASCESTATILRDKVHLLPRQIVVVPCGVRIIQKYQKLPEDFSIIRLLTVGAIKQHKGIHHLPYIAQRLLAMGINFEWTLVGPSNNYEYEQSIKQDIENFGLSEKIRWKGMLSDEQLDEHYRNAHLYVHLASQEGFGLTVLEALATGVPVVGTRVGAIPEMIKHGSGYIVDPNPESIAKGIYAGVRDYSSLLKGHVLAETIQSIYGWKAIAAQTEAIYHSVMLDIQKNGLN